MTDDLSCKPLYVIMIDVFRFFLTLGKLYNDKHIVNIEGTFLHFLEKEYFFLLSFSTN